VLASLQVLHDDQLARSISVVLDRMVFVHDDIIIYAGERGRGMYFISAGLVQILAPPSKRETNFKFGESRQDTPSDELAPLTTLGRHAFFGEMALLNPNGQAITSVRAHGYCEAHHLSASAYAKLLTEFPIFKEYVGMVARLRLAEDLRVQVPDEPTVTQQQVAREAYETEGSCSEMGLEHLFSALEGGPDIHLNHFTQKLLRKAVTIKKPLARQRSNAGARVSKRVIKTVQSVFADFIPGQASSRSGIRQSGVLSRRSALRMSASSKGAGSLSDDNTTARGNTPHGRTVLRSARVLSNGAACKSPTPQLDCAAKYISCTGTIASSGSVSAVSSTSLGSASTAVGSTSEKGASDEGSLNSSLPQGASHTPTGLADTSLDALEGGSLADGADNAYEHRSPLKTTFQLDKRCEA